VKTKIRILWLVECTRRLFIRHYVVKYLQNFYGVALRHFLSVHRIYLSCQFCWWFSHYAHTCGASMEHWSEAYKEQT
jgi:hypothetical protein